MKRKKFIQEILKQGCILLRHGARHDVYLNPATGNKQPVPRQAELDDNLVKHIRKNLGLD